MEIKKYSEILWVEKYRPSTLKHLIIPDRIRRRFEEGKIGSNLLLGGSAGIGKTTLAKILGQDRSVLFINASSNRGIDTVRSQIADFAATSSLTSNKKKLIVLDEADNFSQDAQKALKGEIEKNAKNVLFILTANNPERLITPLHSRLEFINFNFTAEEEVEQKKQYIERIRMILRNEGNFTIDNDAMVYLLKKVYPDLRQIINVLYQSTRGSKDHAKITLADVSTNYGGDNINLYELLITEHQPEKLYAHIKSTYTGKEIQTLNSLGTNFLEYLNNHEKFNNKTLAAAMITHKYMYEATTGSIDPLLPLLACASMLSELFKSA